MLIRKYILSPLVICFSLLLSSCGGGEIRLIEFVPSNSNMIVDIKWSAVRKDEGLKRIIQSDGYEAQIRRFGIDEAEVSELVVFGMIRAETQGGFLLRGSFDARRALAALKAQGWTEDSVEGKKVYASGRDYAASPTEDVFVAGTREGVAAVFRTLKNSREGLPTSASFKKIKAALSATGKSPVSAFLLAPDGTIEMVDAALSVTDSALSLFDMQGIGAILQKLNLASGVGFTIARGKNQKYKVNFSALMRDEKTAMIVSGSLNVLKELSVAVSSGSAKNSETADELRDFNITREKNVLLVEMQMPEEALAPPSSQQPKGF